MSRLDDNARLLAGTMPFDPEEDAEVMVPVSCESDRSEPTDQPWAPLLPLEDRQVPAFPVELLPAPLSQYVSALAEATQVPADLPGALVLAAVAACIQRRVVVQVNAGYIEPTSLFVAVISYPGTRKTAAVGPIMMPIQEWEANQRTRLGPEIERAASERAIKVRRKAALEEEAAKDKSLEKRRERQREAAVLAAELAAEGPIPTYPRVLADDATPEELVRLQAEQGERIALFSAEGGIFEMMAGRYSQGVPNLDVYLKGHAGDFIRVDRRSGQPVVLNHPALTVGLAVQPDVLRTLADKPGFRGRGLIGRFLYSLPPNLMGHRRSGTAPIPRQVTADYGRCVHALLEGAVRSVDGAISLGLTPDAAEIRLAFEQRLEPKLAPDAALAHMGDWAGKSVGAAVRIAGLFHAVRRVHGEEPLGGDIDGGTMEAAVGLVEGYFLPHAEAALDEMGAEPEIENARKVLARVRRRGLREFTVRELHQALRGQTCFRQVDSVAAAVAVLEAHNYARCLAAPHAGAGRPASPRYTVNPLVWKHSQNPQNGPAQ